MLATTLFLSHLHHHLEELTLHPPNISQVMMEILLVTKQMLENLVFLLMAAR
jgi:hypothetical protein